MSITIKFEDEHLPIISRALEAYSRARMGQFGIMIEQMFPEKLIDWDDRDKIEKTLREIIFDEPNMSSLSYSYGIGNENVGGGQAAYEIHKVINQYISVQRSGGKWGYTTDYQDPLEYSGIKLPEVVGFKKYIDYPIPDVDYKFTELYQAENWKVCWEFIDEIVEYDKGEKSEIVAEPYELVGEGHVDYFLRIWKPRLDKEEIPTKGFAVREGWHCCFKKHAPHLAIEPKNGMKRVWRRVEIEDFEELQKPESQGGKWILAKRIKILDKE